MYLQVKQNVALALSCIILASLPSVLGFLPLWLTVCSICDLMSGFYCFVISRLQYYTVQILRITVHRLEACTLAFF